MKASKAWYPAASLLVLVLALCLRVVPLHNESVDGDELFSRRVATGDAATAWNMVRADLVHPPLYYFLLKTTIPGGDSSTANDIRALSLVAGAGAIVALLLIGFAAAELRTPALLAALLLSLNKVHIFFSQQARSYALYCFLVALLLFWRVLADRHWRRWTYWACGTLLMAAILWTHYVGALFCAACAFSMVFLDYPAAAGRRPRILPLVSLAGAGLLFLPWFIPEISVYRQRAGISGNLDWQGLPALFDLKMVFADYVGVPDFRGGTTAALALGIALAACVFVPMPGVRRTPGSTNGSTMRGTLALMAAGPPVMLWLTTRWPLHLPVFGTRHLLPAIAPALLLVCLGLARLTSRARSATLSAVLLAAGVVILCLFQAAPVARAWPGPIRHPYATIAEDLKRTAPDLPAYTTWPHGIGQPVAFYLRGLRRVDPFPAPSDPAELPERFLVLYRPAVSREEKVIQPLLGRYDIVTDKYYSGAASPKYGTRLLVLRRR